MLLGQNSTIDVITNAVDDIREKLGIRISDYPINIFDFAKKCTKFYIIEEHFESSSLGGFLINKDLIDLPVIVINSNNSQENKNFALGHELIHFFCHPKDRTLSASHKMSTSRVREKQANEGAAELLVPAALFENEIKTALSFYEDQTTAFLETAKAYHVAPEVIKYRFFNLGLDK